MYGAGEWNAGELGKLEVAQNKIGSLELEPKKLVETETIRGEMGQSINKYAELQGQIRNLEDSRWVKKVYIMTFSNRLFIKRKQIQG